MSCGATASPAASAVTGRAQPSLSFLNSGTSPGDMSVRYATCQGRFTSSRVKTSIHRKSPPRLAFVFATNQRGQPAFLGMVNSASDSSRSEWPGLPSGWLV